MILSEQELLRRQKRQELIGMGIDPYPAAAFLVSHYSSQILAEYKPELNNFQEVSLAGRLMGFRIMGNASFAELQDSWSCGQTGCYPSWQIARPIHEYAASCSEWQTSYPQQFESKKCHHWSCEWLLPYRECWQSYEC